MAVLCHLPDRAGVAWPAWPLGASDFLPRSQLHLIPHFLEERGRVQRLCR